ncbi:MAG: SxtJ family membrane protein [Thiotrichales bacterium]
MSVTPLNEPTPADLRRFAWVTGALIAGCFGLLLPWLWAFAIPWWPFVTGLALALWGAIAPRSLRPLYRGWMRLGAGLGWLNARLILSAVFFLVLTPIGWLLRLFRHDPLRRAWTPGATSYRVPSQPRPRDHLRRPF